MARECVYCDKAETGSESIVVCHHCGKPMCDQHRKIIEDDAFYGSGWPVANLAVHCADCKGKYHPWASERSRQWPGALQPAQP